VSTSKVNRLIFAWFIATTLLTTKTTANPSILMLDGPNHHWHADPALYSRINAFAPDDWELTTLDRCPSLNEPRCYTSYVDFADELHAQIGQTPTIIVAFASASLTVWTLYERYPSAPVIGVVLIDPDALSLAGRNRLIEDTKPFKQAGPRLFELVDEGFFDERYRARIEEERNALSAVIGADLIDWAFYNYYAERRKSRGRIRHRFETILRYEEDLSNWPMHSRTPSWPLVVIDTAFEDSVIERSEEPAPLIAWRNENAKWSSEAARINPDSSYLALSTKHHELPLYQPQTIVDAIDHILALTQKEPQHD
jgi:hypothetical protein